MMTAKQFQDTYNKQYDYIIGIDAGVNNGWIQFMFSTNVYDMAFTYNFWNLIDDLQNWNDAKVLVLIENPNLIGNIYARHNHKGGSGIQSRIAQNVGSNKRTAQLIIEYCKLNNIDYKEVKPTTRKWTAKEFQQATGITAQCSQHVRDAAKLIYEYLQQKH